MAKRRIPVIAATPAVLNAIRRVKSEDMDFTVTQTKKVYRRSGGGSKANLTAAIAQEEIQSDGTISVKLADDIGDPIGEAFDVYLFADKRDDIEVDEYVSSDGISLSNGSPCLIGKDNFDNWFLVDPLTNKLVFFANVWKILADGTPNYSRDTGSTHLFCINYRDTPNGTNYFGGDGIWEGVLDNAWMMESSSIIRGYEADIVGVGVAASALSIAADFLGNVYIGSRLENDDTLSKYNADGEFEWSVGVGGGVSVQDLATYGTTESNIRICAVGQLSGGNSVWLYDTDGVEQWTFDSESDLRAVAMSNGRVYVGGEQGKDENSFWSINTSTGVEVDGFYQGVINGIDIDGPGGSRIAICGSGSGGDNVWLYDFGLAEIWGASADLLGGPFDVAVDSSGGVCAVGEKTSGKNVIKFNPIGVESWSRDTGSSTLSSVDSDSDGNFFMVGTRDISTF